MNDITIRVLDQKDLEEAQGFLFNMVESLFQVERNLKTHKDIFEIENFYLNTPGHLLLGAYNSNQTLIGTIALKTFIDRFDGLKGRYIQKTAEVGRCYILQAYRRQGIGSLLLKETLERGKSEGYEMLYLHTHPTLPGGPEFWKKSGFKTTLIESGNPDTIHMEMPI